jgi:hypothetical protein
MVAEGSAAVLAGYPPGQVRFRPTPRQALVIYLLPVVILTEQVLFDLDMRSHWQGAPLWPGVLYALALALLLTAALRWFGATLTPDGVLVRNLRRRAIAWHELAAIRVEPMLGTRTVVLYERSGRRTRLRLPATGPLYRDPAFDAKVQLVHDYWVRYSAGTIPPPSALQSHPGFRDGPAGLRARPAWTQRVVVCYVFGWFALSQVLAQTEAGRGSWQRPFAVVAVIVGAAGIWQWANRSGITLTSATLVVHGLRRREIAWYDVQSITTRRRLGGTRLVVTESSGRQTPLPCPRSGLLLWDASFGTKALTVDRWWREHAGGTLPEGSGPEEVVRLAGSGQPKVWQQIVLGLILASMGFCLLVLLLLVVIFEATPPP